SGGDQLGLRKRTSQGLQVFWPAYVSARENFQQPRAVLLRGHQLGRRQYSGNRQYGVVAGLSQHGHRQAGTHQELGAGKDAGLSLRGIGDGSGANENVIAAVLREFANHRHGVGHGHRDFDRRNSSGADRFHGTVRFLDRRSPDNRNDSDLANA